MYYNISMTSYEEYNVSDIIKEFLKSSINPVDIELKSKEMIDSCIKLIKVYKLHDGRRRPLKKIQDTYIDFKYIIQDKNKESPILKIKNFCDRIRELNEDVQEEIINIIIKYNKILEEMIENPRLYLDKNKLSSNSKKNY